MLKPDMPIGGAPVEVDELRLRKAREVVAALRTDHLDYVDYVECRQFDTPDGNEAVISDVTVERSQRTVNDIRRVERIAIVFSADDDVPPEALALRPDFPLVPHLNLRPAGTPPSLCLFSGPYSEEKRHWTAARFIKRIRQWLALTATGELHAADQPLEPLLSYTPWSLVIPSDLFGGGKTTTPPHDAEMLTIYRVSESHTRVLVAQRVADTAAGRREASHVALALCGIPQEHGPIQVLPRTLRELHGCLDSAGIDLLGSLRSAFRQWQGDAERRHLLNKPLILIVALPKTRNATAAPEAVDVLAFACGRTVKEIGRDIGLWDIISAATGRTFAKDAEAQAIRQGQVGLILGDDAGRRGDDVGIDALNTVFAFSRAQAARVNGIEQRGIMHLAAVGVGALGSQVCMNLARSGFGTWTVIDGDYVLPHNLGRHALPGYMVGQAKAGGIADLMNTLFDGESMATPLVVDVLHPAQASDELGEVFERADAILDMSASVAVARHLAHEVKASGRRLSLFLSPTGSDGVLLAEDARREIPLDALEMQYYRLIIERPELKDHLQQAGGRIHYARSCRDVTSVLPQDQVALHAAIGSHMVRAAIASEEARMIVWRVDIETINTVSIHGTPARIVRKRIGEWTVTWDEHLAAKVMRIRSEALPNETGGILVGAFDTERNIIYIVDTVPSPADSEEQPTLYIRGCQDLSRAVENIQAITSHELGYVGEWHAHPRGHDATQSTADRMVLSWLAREMGGDGLPGLMMIAGDGGAMAWYTEQAR